jgi:hypothetical protein
MSKDDADEQKREWKDRERAEKKRGRGEMIAGTPETREAVD